MTREHHPTIVFLTLLKHDRPYPTPWRLTLLSHSYLCFEHRNMLCHLPLHGLRLEELGLPLVLCILLAIMLERSLKWIGRVIGVSFRVLGVELDMRPKRRWCCALRESQLCHAKPAPGRWIDCCRCCKQAGHAATVACCCCCRAAHRTAALPWLPCVAHLAMLGLLGRLAACRCCLLLLKLGTRSLLHLSGLQWRQRRSTASGESLIIAMPTRAALLFRRLRCRRNGLRRRFAGVLALRHISD